MNTEDMNTILRFVINNPDPGALSFSDMRTLYDHFRRFSKDEIDRALRTMETSGLVKLSVTLEGIEAIKPTGAGDVHVHDSREATLALAKSKAEARKEKLRLERDEWIKFWIPVSLSIVAIITSI